jgi:hypothetical protein
MTITFFASKIFLLHEIWKQGFYLIVYLKLILLIMIIIIKDDEEKNLASFKTGKLHIYFIIFKFKFDFEYNSMTWMKIVSCPLKNTCTKFLKARSLF